MSLHFAGGPHPDAPRRPSEVGRVVLARREEVYAVEGGSRRLHLVPPDFGNRDRWSAGGVYLVQARAPERDPMEPNKIPEPGPSSRVRLVEAELVTLGSLVKDDARLMFGKTGSLRQLQSWWLQRHDAVWWSSLTEDRVDEETGQIIEGTPWSEFERRWAGWKPWQVWRLRWTLDTTHRPRLLAQDGAGEHDEPYVTSGARALPGVGEAVPREVQAEYTRDAQGEIAEKVAARACESAEEARKRALAGMVARQMRRDERSKKRNAHRLATRSAGGAS